MSDIFKITKGPYSEEDKARLIEIIKTCLSVSEKERQIGLLSREEGLRELQPFLLRKGVELVINGCYRKDLRYILNSYITAGNFTGIELLERLVIREWALLFQNRERFDLIFEKLVSLLGEDFYHSIEGLDLKHSQENKFDWQSWLAEEDPPVDAEDSFTEEIIKVDTCEKMERILLKIGCCDMALAIKGASKKAMKHVLHNLSEADREDIIDRMKLMGPIRLCDAKEVQETILNAQKDERGCYHG
jgi:hypothetical protein